MAKTKDVAKKPDKNLVPAGVYDYGEDAGSGFEDMGREDFAIPYLYLLQANSPVVVKDEIGAKAGMIMNTVTQDLYPANTSKGEDGVLFVPCFSQHLFVEWVPIDAGGGLVAQHDVDSQIVLDAKASGQPFGKWKTPDGNELVDTFYVYGQHVKSEDEWEPAVIAFNSTKIKPYRNWMTRMKTMRVPTPGGGKITPPMWAHIWRFKSVMQTKDTNSFYNFEIGFAQGNAAESRLAPSSELFQEAKSFHELCKEGMVRVATETLQREPGDENESGEQVPF